VHVVALIELRGPVEAEAASLARDLGTTVYEERLKLAAGLPAILLTSADAGAAHDLAAKIAARGHEARVCDSAAVIPNDAMFALRRFAFEPDALTSLDPPGRLPYHDVLALIRASHQSRTETRTETKSKQFSAGRAILSGGLVMRKNVTREEKTVANEREYLLYIFRVNGETPWILRERGTQYAGLGDEAGPSSAQNFLAFIARLRKMAKDAIYDERLLHPRGAPSRVVRTGGAAAEAFTVSSASGVDLMAHLLAQSFGGRR
jgi:hypothetical protein